jgi:hypothetical protein
MKAIDLAFDGLRRSPVKARDSYGIAHIGTVEVEVLVCYSMFTQNRAQELIRDVLGIRRQFDLSRTIGAPYPNALWGGSNRSLHMFLLCPRW